MNKAVYITFQYVSSADGVSKKVFGQVQSLRNLGVAIDFIYPKKVGDRIVYYCNDVRIHDINLCTNPKTQIKELFHIIELKICENKYDFSYIRYNCNSNGMFRSLLRAMCNVGTKTFLEIPTYPYDEELKYCDSKNIIKKFLKYIVYIREKINRKRLKNYVYRIVTSSEHKCIFGIKTLQISNAVNPEKMCSCDYSCNVDIINLVTVANIAFWHGIDRVIEGIYRYYNDGNTQKVIFHIIGNGNETTIEYLKQMVSKYNLEDIVLFHGAKDGEELESLFKYANFAIGCLGCHRKNITEVKSLKNVEYAMRGLPFIYSEMNSDFDNQVYIMKAPADDTPINIKSIIDFILNNKEYSSDIIRDSVKHLTWDYQMRKVLTCVENQLE